MTPPPNTPVGGSPPAADGSPVVVRLLAKGEAVGRRTAAQLARLICKHRGHSPVAIRHPSLRMRRRMICQRCRAVLVD